MYKRQVDNWLPRYTGRELKDFSKYILLTNFEYYLELFSELYQVPIVGADKTMPNVSCNGITLVNFGMGSPNAATILDLLSAIEPEAVLFIGKCGGIKEKNSVGDYILPIAAKMCIRDRLQTALHFFPPHESGGRPKVMTCSAYERTGIDGIWENILHYCSETLQNGYFDVRRAEQSKYWMYETIDEQLRNHFYQSQKENLKIAEKQVMSNQVSSCLLYTSRCV